MFSDTTDILTFNIQLSGDYLLKMHNSFCAFIFYLN